MAELSLTSPSASIGPMFIGKLALVLAAVFAVALVMRLVLGFRNFQRLYDESAEDAAERFRQQIVQPPSLAGGSDKPRSQ